MAATATAERPKTKAAPEYPTRKPLNMHGLQTKRVVVTPEQALRDLLGLSYDVPLDQVLTDAAVEIRELREMPALEDAPSTTIRKRGRMSRG